MIQSLRFWIISLAHAKFYSKVFFIFYFIFFFFVFFINVLFVVDF